MVVRWHQDHIKRLFTICKALTRRTIPCVWACAYLGCDSWQTDNRRAWYSLRHQLAQLMRDQRWKAEAYHIVARMAHLATDLAWHFDGNMGHVARLIGGEMMAEHRDADLIQQYFAQTGFPEMAQLMEAVRHGVPVDVDGGGDLLASMQYGNHSSAYTHYDVVWQRLVEDITWGRVVVLHKSAAEFVSHLRISPLGVSSSKEKLRVILDLSFGKGGAVDEYIGVNGDTAFEKAPKSETGGVMPVSVRRVCALREAIGPDVPIYTSKMDVKDAFRRLHVAWEKAPTFAYMVNDLIVVDFFVYLSAGAIRRGGGLSTLRRCGTRTVTLVLEPLGCSRMRTK